jgi:chromosome segregation ATPase
MKFSEQGVESVMATAERSAIPARMLEELSQLRGAQQHKPKEEQRTVPDAEIDQSIELIRQATEYMKARSDQVIELEQQAYVLKQENAKLMSECEQAQSLLQELKHHIAAQANRADSAENYVRQLENQLNAAELAKKETRAKISRLTRVIEQAFDLNDSVAPTRTSLSYDAPWQNVK